MIRKLFLISILILAFAVPGWGATYYMQFGGTAANHAAAGGPCGTQANCIDFDEHEADGGSLSDGDIIIVCDDGGIYRDQLDIPASGSSTGITYEAASGDTPIINGSDLVSSWTQYVQTGDTFHSDYEEDSEGADPSEWDSVTETNATCNAEAAAKKNGTYGMRSELTAAGGTGLAIVDFGSPIGEIHLGFWFRWHSGEADGAWGGLTPGGWDGANQNFRINWNYDIGPEIKLEVIGYDDDTTAHSVSTDRMTEDTYYWVNIAWKAGDGNGYIKVRLDGGAWSQFTTLDNDATRNEIDELRLGFVDTNTDMGIGDYFDFDEVLIDASNDYPEQPTDAYYATLASAPKNVYEDPSDVADSTPYTVGASIQEVIDNASYWYHTGSTLYIQTSGSDNPSGYTIEATQRDYGITGASKDYITIDGLTILRVEQVGIFDDQGDSWIIKNNTVRNYGNGATTPVAGIQARGDPSGATQASGIEIYGNTIGRADCSTAIVSNRNGISVGGTTGAKIYKNYIATVNTKAFQANIGNFASSGATSELGEFYENEITNCQNGPEIATSDNWKIYRNYQHDSYGLCWGVNWGSDDAEVYYNVAYNVTTSSGDGRYNGLDVNANADGGKAYGNSFAVVDGVLCTIEDYSASADNWIIKNNIFDKRGSDGNTCVQIFFACSNITLENNIYIVEPGFTYGWRLEVSDESFTVYDVYATWKTAAETAGHSLDSEYVETDPEFVNVGSGDLTLQSSSPAIDVGENLGASYDDALDPTGSWVDAVNTSDQDTYGNWEIGAYIWAGSARGAVFSGATISQ